MSTNDDKGSSKTLGLGQDFTANKAARSTELGGRRLVAELYDGGRFTLDFHDGESLTGSGLFADAGGASARESYEAQKVAADLFLIAFQRATDPHVSASVVIDWRSGEIVLIRNKVEAKQPGIPAVKQTVSGGRIVGQPWVGPRIEPSSELHGRRAMWVYSENDVYEHIYLNASWYVWHCLKGDEYPLADADPCATLKVREGIYLLTFSEKVMTMAAAMVLDFGALRSYCAAIGRDSKTAELSHFTFGAFGTVLSETHYPSPLVA